LVPIATSAVAESTGDRTSADPAPASEDGSIRARLLDALPSCRAETIERLVQTVQRRSLKRGEHIYRQGEPVPLTLILAGYGAARRTTVNGRELLYGIGPPGLLFGWSGLAAVPSSVGLIALTDCEIGQWQGSEIRTLASADPSLAFAAIDSMAWSIHQSVERMESFHHQDARLRVIRILAQHRDLFFGESAFLTRTHLPGLVGTSREMTGRVLRQLEREGTLARVGSSGLKLLRPDRLDVDSA
jgi:CRP-like cAMP-binding protein